VARYREKDELDLVWNKVRRRVTRDLDTRIMDFREELLNGLLVEAWDRYTAAIDRGEKPVLEDEASTWIKEHLDRYLRPALKEIEDEVAERTAP
jgi:hypothetical protein